MDPSALLLDKLQEDLGVSIVYREGAIKNPAKRAPGRGGVAAYIPRDYILADKSIHPI
jgi:hypothetical protein